MSFFESKGLEFKKLSVKAMMGQLHLLVKTLACRKESAPILLMPFIYTALVRHASGEAARPT